MNLQPRFLFALLALSALACETSVAKHDTTTVIVADSTASAPENVRALTREEILDTLRRSAARRPAVIDHSTEQQRALKQLRLQKSKTTILRPATP